MCKISDSNAGLPCVVVWLACMAMSPSERKVSSAGRNTSGKMVAWQQNWFHLGGAGVLYLDLEQLGGAGSFGIVIHHYRKSKVSFLSIKKWVIYQH